MKPFWRNPRTAGLAVALACLFGSWLGSASGQPALGQLALVLAGAALGVAVVSGRRPSAPVLDAADSFRLLIEKAPDFLSVLNADGTVRYRSPSFERFLGYPSGELAGRSTFDFIHPDDRPRVLRTFQDLVTEPGGTCFIELRFRLADGSYRDLDVVGSNLLHEARVAGVVVNSRDVTERKRAEARQAALQESLRKSETMSAMGQIVAGVAHEVRNPLFAISANLDALEIQFGDDSPHAKTFTVLHGEVDRLSDLMQELLDYGRPHSLEVTPGTLSEVVSQAIRATLPLARSREVEMLDAVPGGLPPVPMDAKRIGQVFRNLIENAIQHTGPGGHVMVTAAVGEGNGQAQVVCSILDEGTGFREQDLPRIFEPFFTRRRGGTGLGLSIVARIVEEHGGRVTAANRPEGGAVMEVKLPLEPMNLTGAA
jgi:PAS domain S-box-containing protein